MPAIKVKVKFPDPLLELWSELPEIDDMPYYSTKANARIAMLKEVRELLLDSPKMRDPKKLLEIARPITTKMTQLRPSLSREFDSHLYQTLSRDELDIICWINVASCNCCLDLS